MSTVTVVCPNAHRCKISVTAGTVLRQILEECCLKQGYDVDSYTLQHRNKPLDDSLPYRLSGLPNNACLDLIKSEEKKVDHEVEIALQTPEGRKISKFISSTMLADVLKKFSEEFGKDLLKAEAVEE
uniref:TUG ubiquitin-like domain-containing protein n=1 Tax=Panagrolaimus davidi TaxID=227884 RepID=A0A914PS16_9BILA